jgi:uncharacterized protein (TIGR00255 family)
MTGFGRSKGHSEQLNVTVEIKTVNHRFLEYNIRMPRQLLKIEDLIKKKIEQYINRGRVEVFVLIEGKGAVKNKVNVDWSLLDEYYHTIEKIIEKYNLRNEISLQDLLSKEEFISIGEEDSDDQELESLVINTVEQAVSQLKRTRITEGIALEKDIENQLFQFNNKVNEIKDYAPNVVSYYAGRLKKRMEELVNGPIDENRLMNEVAIFADKADINEELTRLESHIQQFKQNMKSSDPIGRKLDFFLQEMNREVNTIGSKANDSAIAKEVVEMKSLLEKMKEQVQNIE